MKNLEYAFRGEFNWVHMVKFDEVDIIMWCQLYVEHIESVQYIAQYIIFLKLSKCYSV